MGTKRRRKLVPRERSRDLRPSLGGLLAFSSNLTCGTNPFDSGALVCTEAPLVHPGSVPFVSQRAVACGRLLLTNYERMMTGGLSACDWLTPVMRGAWRVAPPVSATVNADVS